MRTDGTKIQDGAAFQFATHDLVLDGGGPEVYEPCQQSGDQSGFRVFELCPQSGDQSGVAELVGKCPQSGDQSCSSEVYETCWFMEATDAKVGLGVELTSGGWVYLRVY